jgi:amidase
LPFFGQELFLTAQEKGPLTEPAYLEALATSQRLGGVEGIEAVMERRALDALVAPAGTPAWLIDLVNGDHEGFGSSSPAAQAGLPIVTVPAGFVFGLPVGISFMGRRFGEARLIALAYSFEQATRVWRPPRFLPTVPLG